MYLTISKVTLYILLSSILAINCIAQETISQEKKAVHFDISLLGGVEGFQNRSSMNDALSQNNFIHLSDWKPLTIGLELNVTNKRNLFKASVWLSGLDSVDGSARSNISKHLFLASYGYDLIPRSDVYLFPFGGLALSVMKLDCVSKNDQILKSRKIDLLFQSGIGVKFRKLPGEPRKSFIPAFGLYFGAFFPVIKRPWKATGTSELSVPVKMETRTHCFLTITAGFSF